MQGVVAGSRVYHQRRHSGFPGDTWPDQPCVPAARFFRHSKGLSSEPQLQCFYSFTVATICIIRRNHVADDLFFAEIMSPKQYWWLSWTWKSLSCSSIIRRMHRKLICFLSNLHVTGFSSCWITIMIHSYLVCVCIEMLDDKKEDRSWSHLGQLRLSKEFRDYNQQKSSKLNG